MDDSVFIRKIPCPECGSRDNAALYSDGHETCFTPGCKHYKPPTGERGKMTPTKKKATGLISCEPARAIPARGLTEETTRLFGYCPSTYKGRPAQVANYIKDNKLVAQHIRQPDKKFVWKNHKDDLPLFGQWLWDKGGKKLVITEGQIDAMSVSQLQGNKWAVVSINSGAGNGHKDIRANIEFVESFDEVIFMFDMDDAGQEGAVECAKLLTPGKAKIARLPLKDANECLLQRRGKEVLNAVWSAKEYRPDGIIGVDDINIDELFEEISRGWELPFKGIQEMFKGIHPGTLTLITAGSGIGKSTLAREIQFHLGTHHKLKTAAVYLEENYKKTFKGMAAIDNNVPLGNLVQNPQELTKEQYESTKAKFQGRLFFYDHFGSMESDTLMDKMTYLRVGLGCDVIVLDHISMVVSDQDGSGEGERKDIDRLMTKLRSFIERTGVAIIAIVHLKRPSGGRRGFNNGGSVTLQDLRGSASLEQLSDSIIALERDQQSRDEQHVAHVRGLKNRLFGVLGSCGYVRYDVETGRMLDHVKKDSDDYFGDDDDDDDRQSHF